MLRMAGIEVAGKIHDTLILTHVATGGSELTYALKPLGKKYLDYPDDDEKALQEATQKARAEARKKGYPVAEKDLMGREPIKADYWMAPPEICERYAVSDAERTMLLFHTVFSTVSSNPDLLKVYHREMELFFILQKMENTGVQVFPIKIKELMNFYVKYMKEQVEVSEREGKPDLNFRSPKQLTKIFYEERNYAPKYTAKGNYALDSDTLARLADSTGDRLAKAILEYRAASHTVSSFLKVYERWRVEESPGSWVLHPNFRQCGPVTGRLSCSDPNLMQVASSTTGRRKSDVEYRPREAFGPRKGCLWYLPDYSQIEVWLFASLSGDKQFLDTMMTGTDAHGEICKKIWGNAPDFEERKSYYRKRAKLLVFCKLYGGGIRKVAKLLESTEEEAARFVEDFDSKFPGAKLFMNRMINRADREGMIQNPFGRVYYIDKGFAYRAVNYLIQGTGADVLKNAMINLDQLFKSKWKGVKLLLPLHDEIIIEVPLEFHSKSLMRDIVKAMQMDSQKVGVPIPLPVGMKISTKSWDTTQEVTI